MKNKVNHLQSTTRETLKGNSAGKAFFHLKPSLWYAGTILMTIIAGLCSRVFADQLPYFVSLHFGDALWAAMVYFGFRTLFVKRKLAFASLAALLFSFVIEFSQLYQASWINEIRATLPGSLILGRGFLAVDLLRYSAGIAFAFLLDHFLLRSFFLSPNIEKEL